MFVFCTTLVFVYINLSFAQPAKEIFRFVVIGDTRPHGDNEDPVTQPEEFKDNIRAVNLLRPDFVINVGDLIRGYTNDTDLIIKEWEDFDHTIKLFKMPFYMVIGNHDVWDEESQRIYKERYGPLYYSFDFKGSHFVVLDSEEANAIDSIVGKQLAWLEEDLAEHAEADHIFVFLHKPLWTWEKKNWSADVHPILARYRVAAVFAGHRHVYTKWKEMDGVKYFITGGGGAELHTLEELGGFYHFMHVSVHGEEVNYAVVRPEGVQPADIVTNEMVAKAYYFQRSIVPSLTISEAGKFCEKVTLSLSNPFTTPIEGKISWNIPEASSWKANPIRCEFALGKEDSLELSFQLLGDAQMAFPLPEIYCELFCNGRMIISHSSKLQIKNDWFIRKWIIIGPFE
ncbi:MAG: metallophosphoesterase, partial [Euryarchaeota archaeon]|nr:metallophosphoesterase [Euryarchaeota archaeon]